MLQRAISGLVFITILISATLYSPFTFTALFLFLLIVAIYEYKKLANSNNKVLYILAVSCFLTTVNKLNFLPISVPQEKLEITNYLVLFSTFLFSLFDSKKFDPFKRIGKIFLGYIYIIIPFTFIISIPFSNEFKTYEGTTILGALILIWSSDTFAYLTGMTIGKTKLLERISPKKTIEGFAGGLIATLIVGYILSIYFTQFNAVTWVAIALIVAVFGMLGDLIESMFKRASGIKDSGNLIPGHGGVLDRFDSLIYAAPFIYIFLQYIY